MFRISKEKRAGNICMRGTAVLCAISGMVGVLSGCSFGQTDTDVFQEEEKEELLLGELNHTGSNQYYTTESVYVGDFVTTRETFGTPYYPVYENVTIENSDTAEEMNSYSEIVFAEYFVGTGDMVESGDPVFSYTLSTQVDEVTLASEKLSLQRQKEDYAEYVSSMTTSQAEWYAEIVAMPEGSDKQIQLYQYTKSQIQYEEYVASMQEYIAAKEQNIYNMENNATYVVNAPIAGMVTEIVRDMKEGDAIGMTDVMAVINSDEEFLIQIDSEESVGYRIGQTVLFSQGTTLEDFDAENAYQGTVVTAPSALSAQMLQSGASYIYIRPDEEVDAGSMEMNHDNNFHWGWEDNRSGFHVAGHLVEETDVLLVPAAAVQMDNGEYYVDVLEDGVLKKRFFTSGGSNGEVFWAIEGLEEGMQVVLP